MSNVQPYCSQLCHAIMPDGQPVRQHMTYKKYVVKEFVGKHAQFTQLVLLIWKPIK